MEAITVVSWEDLAPETIAKLPIEFLYEFKPRKRIWRVDKRPTCFLQRTGKAVISPPFFWVDLGYIELDLPGQRNAYLFV